MADYAAFLRGINVGGVRVAMGDLKAVVEGLGCTAVATYLQTGNLTLSADLSPEDLTARLEQALSSRFSYPAFVQVLTTGDLAALVAAYPFARDDDHHAYVVLVNDAARRDELLAAAAGLDEPTAPAERGFYWRAAKGETLGSPVGKLLAQARFKPATTTRNLRTLELMLAP